MCEAEDELYDLREDYRRLELKYDALRNERGMPADEPPEIANLLCDAIDDMERGILTPEEFFARTQQIRRPATPFKLRAA